MTADSIEKFIEVDKRKSRNIQIHFKTRSTVTGVFIVTGDYNEMKSKNFWRIIPGPKLEQWWATKDPSLSRLFHGAEFARLTEE